MERGHRFQLLLCIVYISYHSGLEYFRLKHYVHTFVELRQPDLPSGCSPENAKRISINQSIDIYLSMDITVPNHPPQVGARQLSDRVSSMTVFCYLYQMMSQKFSKNQDNFFKAIFIYCINCRIVGEVVLLKSKRAGFWANGQFTPRSAYILLIPQVLYRQVIFYRK